MGADWEDKSNAVEDVKNMSAGESFELIEIIGSGDCTTVWRARVMEQTHIDEFGREEVALKIPAGPNFEQLRLLLKFSDQRVGRHLIRQTSMNINFVRHFGICRFRGENVLVVEYVQGGSLRRLLGPFGRQKQSPVDAAVQIARGILHALEGLHELKLSHGNLAPENILIDGLTPKIYQFSLWTMLDSPDTTAANWSSTFYMSPEALIGETESFAGDIWAVGVILYEMLTGKHPFVGKNDGIRLVMDSIRKADPVPVCALRSDVSTGLSDVVARALKKDPCQRFASAGVMLAELRQASEDAEEAGRRSTDN